MILLKYQAEIESLLYIAGDEGITLTQLSQLLLLDEPALRQLLQQLQDCYQANGDSGLALVQLGEVYKLVTKAAYADLIKAYFDGPISTSVSQAALEVLAIIAYRQPLTRIEVDEIRGVQSSGALQTLLTRQLIVEAGRKEAPGRPILYATSAYFLDYFGLKSLQELPALESLAPAEAVTGEQPPADLFFEKFQATLNESENKKENE